MIEFKAEDLHLSLYSSEKRGNWNTSDHDVGVHLIHLPTGTKVSCEKYKSSHKNKHFCMTVLQDILTPFKVGDIIVTNAGKGEVTKVHHPFKDLSFAVEDGTGRMQSFDKVAHTKEGYIYKNMERLQEELTTIEEGYYNDRDILLEEIKQLEDME